MDLKRKHQKKKQDNHPQLQPPIESIITQHNDIDITTIHQQPQPQPQPQPQTTSSSSSSSHIVAHPLSFIAAPVPRTLSELVIPRPASSASVHPAKSKQQQQQQQQGKIIVKFSKRLSTRNKHTSNLNNLTKKPIVSLSSPEVMASCTLGGHLDSPTDLRDVLGSMISDPQLHSLCDVVLIVQGERFMAHRAVLAAASCVFKAMFTNCMKERDESEITLSSVDKHSWKMVMQYIYNAQIDLNTDDDGLILLSTARMYQLERLEMFIETFLMQRVTIANTFRLIDAAEKYELKRLKHKCYVVMEKEFENLILSPAFMYCPVNIMVKLFSSGELIIKSEIIIFEAIIRWIQSDVCAHAGDHSAKRKEHLESLLALINLERMCERELKEVARYPDVDKCWKFKQRIFEQLIKSSSDPMTDKALSCKSHLKVRRRDAHVFTFAHTQRGMTKVPQADQEEVVRTPWSTDASGKGVWRLKIYPQGYSRAKGQYLSMYVQGRSVDKSQTLDVTAKFDIFLVNQKDEGSIVSFSSQHHFLETSDHWGFHRFLQLSQMVDTSQGYLDEASDSVVVGANIYFSS